MKTRLNSMETRLDKLGTGQENIKQCFKENNVAIGEIVMEAIGSHKQRHHLNQSNVYRLLPVE